MLSCTKFARFPFAWIHLHSSISCSPESTRQKEHLPLKRTIIFYNDVHFFYYSKCYCNSYSIRCANWQKQFFLFFFFLKGCSDNHEIHRGGFKQSATQKNQIARSNPLADNSCQALKWQNKCLSHFLLLRFLFLSHIIQLKVLRGREGGREGSNHCFIKFLIAYGRMPPWLK